MAKKVRKRAKVNIGLAHVEAALDMVAQHLEDIRLVVGELRRQEEAGGRLSILWTPGLPCLYMGPGKPCGVGPGKPCLMTGPGKPCGLRPKLGLTR